MSCLFFLIDKCPEARPYLWSFPCNLLLWECEGGLGATTKASGGTGFTTRGIHLVSLDIYSPACSHMHHNRVFVGGGGLLINTFPGTRPYMCSFLCNFLLWECETDQGPLKRKVVALPLQLETFSKVSQARYRPVQLEKCSHSIMTGSLPKVQVRMLGASVTYLQMGPIKEGTRAIGRGQVCMTTYREGTDRCS